MSRALIGALALALVLAPGARGDDADARPNPMLKGLRVGDTWVSKRTLLHQGAEPIKETLTEVVTGLETGKVRTEVRTLWRGKTTLARQETRLEKTLKGQLLAAFRKEGKVELEHFSIKPQAFRFKDTELKAEAVNLRFFWTVNNKRERFVITLIRSDAVPGLGDLKWTIQGERYRVEIALDSFKRGPKKAD